MFFLFFWLLRAKPTQPKEEEQVSDEKLEHTFNRAKQALIDIDARIERIRTDASYDSNPGLLEFALKGENEMRAIMQNIHDTTLKALEERRESKIGSFANKG